MNIMRSLPLLLLHLSYMCAAAAAVDEKSAKELGSNRRRRLSALYGLRSLAGNAFGALLGAREISTSGRRRRTDDDAANRPDDDGTTIDPERTVFGTEDECASAARDERRPCLCYTADYLNSLGRLSDETAESDEPESAFRCGSYKAVPAVFVVRLSDAPVDGDGVTTTTAAARREVDLARAADYRLESSADEHFALHYGLVGSDLKVRCLFNGTGMNTFKWNYRIEKHKKNSTIIGTDTINLSILKLEPADSKNYTCSPNTDAMKNGKNDSSYTHYVIAVGKPIYEVRGTAIYKTSDSGMCTHEITGLVRKQLPRSVRAEMCPEGTTRFACNVVIETSACLEDKKTLEIIYSVTMNDEADFPTKIRTSRKGRKALYYQQTLARVSTVLAENLNKTMAVQIVSKLSSIETRFEPEHKRMKIETYVTCEPGFGIREVFCAACPPHHYNPNKSADCLPCPRGFHQPIAGSKECVKCPSPFASGCSMKRVSSSVFYFAGFIGLLILATFVSSCLCCCREENEKDIKILPKRIRKKLKKSKSLSLVPPIETYVKKSTSAI